MFGAIQSVASSLGVELRPIDIRDTGEMERAVVEFAGAPNGGLIVTPSAQSRRFRDLIFTLAARHRLPTVYSDRSGVVSGGLISYGARESTSTATRLSTSIAFLRVRSRPICRCKHRPSTNW